MIDKVYQVEDALFVGGNGSYVFKPNNNLPLHYNLGHFEIMRTYHTKIKGISNKLHKILVHNMHHRDSKDMEFLTATFKGKSNILLLKTLL